MGKPGRRTLSAVFLIGLLVASAIAAGAAWDSERDRADVQNAERAFVAATGVRSAVAQIGDTMRAAEGVVTDSGRMPPDRFRAFTREVLRDTSFSNLAWAPVVTRSQRASFERSSGQPIGQFGGGRRLIPREADERYLPIELIEPPAAAGAAVRGFDLLSVEERRAAIRSAVVSGRPTVTEPITTLIGGVSGASVVDPVYDRGASLGSVDERNEALVGVLTAGISGEEIAAAVRRQTGLRGPIEIRDGAEPIVGPPLGDDTMSRDVAVLGRRWQVTVRATSSASPTGALAFGAGGLVITVLAAGLLWAAGRRERELAARRAEAERRAARDSLMTRIAEQVEVKVGFEERLGTLAQTMVPAVGDLCVVHAVTPSGAVRRAGVAAVEEEIVQELHELDAVPLTSPVYAAIQSGEPVLYTRFAGEREGRPEPTVAGIRGVRSNMIVPLVARNRVLGTLSLSVLRSTGRDAFTREDLAFAMEVATHAAVALDNARLYDQQLGIAQVLQRALLPRSLPAVKGAEVAASHRPGISGAEMGGDFYDLFQVNGHWLAVVGDVCGKGPEAAAMTALVRHTLRATASDGAVSAVQRVHEAMQASDDATFCTLCCAELRVEAQGVRADVVTAGHPEPRLVTAAGEVRRLEVTGPLVGALDSPSYGIQELHLGHGDLLFMCSDGVPEARRGSEVFGDERLEELLAGLASLSADAMIARLEEVVVDFVEGRPRDDLALFAVRAR